MDYFKLKLFWSMLLLLTTIALAVDDSALDPLESDFTLPGTGVNPKPNPQESSYISPSRILLNRLRKNYNPKVNSLQSHERDSTLENQYKPWGAASSHLQNQDSSMNGNEVVLDKLDDELFTPNSEVHRYDQQLRRNPS